MPTQQSSNQHKDSLENELAQLLNKYSQESASNTPDYVLARYLMNCLDNFNITVSHRERSKE